MHTIEPYFNWRHLYTAEEDERSPFYGHEYSEFEFRDAVYNYVIHPQWENFGSSTLYLKLIYADYDLNFAIIELIGEWNDAVENDIMTLKREVLDVLREQGISKFIFIAENLLNFHSGEDDYYQEWQEELKEEEGWAIMLNVPPSTMYDYRQSSIGQYFIFTEMPNWRTFQPVDMFQYLDNAMLRLLD